MSAFSTSASCPLFPSKQTFVSALSYLLCASRRPTRDLPLNSASTNYLECFTTVQNS